MHNIEIRNKLTIMVDRKLKSLIKNERSTERRRIGNEKLRKIQIKVCGISLLLNRCQYR